MPKQQSLGRIAGFGILLAPLLASAAHAEDFYKGKTISLLESGLTGAYDGYARALARCMPRYIPGNPAIVVQGKPGAAGVVAANYLYNIAPRDGTVIATVHGNVLVAPLLSTGQVKFDLAKFGWIGNVTHDTYVGYVMSTAPIKTLADARTTEVSMAGTSVGAGGIDMAILGRDLFGFKFKIVSGYKTSGETELALERGEVEGTFGHAWGSLKNQKPDWLRDGRVRIIVQHGFTRNAELPDVPLLFDFAQTELERQILGVELVRQDISKPYLAPPNVPPANLAILRSAFSSCMQDADFIAEVKQRHLELDRPMDGEELAALVARISQTPAAAAKKLQDLLSGFRG
jgi:tripartite-type tricarboxylate transporter receptor subunit TctC